MKIKIQGFLGQNHSWANVHWGLATALLKAGHQVDLFATDGIEHLPNHLKKHLIGYIELDKPTKIFGHLPNKEYDMQFSYSCIKNFPTFLTNGNKNRFGMWSYEWYDKNILPIGFAKGHLACDKMFVPSEISKQGFSKAGIPEEKLIVLPHGIDIEQYQGSSTVDLGTKKTFKVLANIAQTHKRKNISGLLEAWGRAFTKDDDVCLILKAKEKKITQPFEVSLNDCLAAFHRKFPRAAEIKVYSVFLDDISSLYRSIDAVFTMSFTECFYFPALEALASGKLNIAPNYGGQLDFLNETNALLIDGKMERADPSAMYWSSKANATWFVPSIEDAAEKLRYARDNFERLNKKLSEEKKDIWARYSWSAITDQLIWLCK